MPAWRYWGIELLAELDHARDIAIDLDRQAGHVGLVPREALVGQVPPARDLRRLVDAAQRFCVFRCHGPQDHAPHAEAARLGPRT
jgi:hypothetical protein